MEQNLISVIMPVYKTEESHLRKAIESVINQSYRELEIVLVDDGSPDNSGEICDTYASKDDRISVIHKKNGGTCEARNYGLSVCTGDFIMIIDGDDWLENDCVEYMVKLIKQTNSDMAYSDHVFTTRDRKQIEKDCIETWSPGKAAAMIVYPYMPLGPWNKIYRKSLLDENNIPKKVAGCPPDAFSETGQLWGNPIYDWNYMDDTGYSWWIDRVRESFKLYDILRIDHFRGFEAYWQIPYGDETAVNGEWVKGPGIKLFNAIKEELGEVNVIAEDLGYLTQEVIDFRNETGFPGMKVLQFAFDSREESDYLPHNYPVNSIAYTGTHDNDTFRGWFEVTGNREDVEYSKKYLKLTEEEGYNWGFIRGVWSSVSHTAIALMQDFLNLGNEARINYPSTLGGNWQWRVKDDALTDELAEKIYDITKLYGRVNINE